MILCIFYSVKVDRLKRLLDYRTVVANYDWIDSYCSVNTDERKGPVSDDLKIRVGVEGATKETVVGYFDVSSLSASVSDHLTICAAFIISATV
jgi:hypothetical protein